MVAIVGGGGWGGETAKVRRELGEGLAVWVAKVIHFNIFGV